MIDADSFVQIDQLEGVVEGVAAAADPNQPVLLGKTLAQKQDFTDAGGVNRGDRAEVQGDGPVSSGGKLPEFLLKLFRRFVVQRSFYLQLYFLF